MKYIFSVLIVLLVIYCVYQAVRVTRLISISKMLVDQGVAFSITPQNPREKFLIIGDSLNVGVGASSSDSIAGRLSKDHPNAEIINVSVSGARMADGLKAINKFDGEHKFDVVIVQLGANDIVYFTPMSQTTDELHQILKKAASISDEVIFLTAGSVGQAPMIPFPASSIYEWRSKAFFAATKQVAADEGAIYIDLYYPRSEDPFLKNIPFYYAPDRFHLSGNGYGLWYQKIKTVLENMKESGHGGVLND